MSYGDVLLGDTVAFKFTTTVLGTGPTTLLGTPALEVYEDNGTTQITAGITLTVDFDGVTGLNDVAIVASGANGFEAGKNYQVVVSVGTVGGQSVVGTVVEEFSVEARVVSEVVGEVGAIGAGGIDATSFAAGAIDAAAIAASAIGSSELAAGAITSAKFAANAVDAAALATDAVNEIVAAVFARAFAAAYGSLTFDEMIKVFASALAGVCSGMATNTAVFRNLANSADVITASVDADGNRASVTLTP